MNRDQLVGALLLVGSVTGIGVYAWLLYTYTMLVLQLTAFLAVAVILSILAWIGYTLATTPPPKPIEEIEKEIEEELKKLEKEVKEKETEERKDT